MKRWLLIPAAAAVVALASACGGGNTASAPPAAPVAAPAPAPAPPNASEALPKLEQEWVAAILAKDTATVERLLDDGFVGTNGEVRYTKEEAVNDVRTGTHEKLDMSHLEVFQFGDAAVTTFDQAEKSRHGKDDFSGSYLFTNMWVVRDGAWRAVASHGSRRR